MRKSLAAFCLEKGLQELLGQWDQERNAPLTPETISYGSKRKVWWRCSKGHEWLAQPYARTGSETGCPYCAGKLPIPGETDLGTLFPNLTREWHPIKNGSLTPDQVLPGSHQKVWWRCANGHDWMAQVKSRVSGCGCPVCANKIVEPARTDLATVAPAVAAQWHPTKNGTLTRHDAQGLVALRKGPRLAGIGVCAGAAGGRMPLLRRQKGTARRKRSGHLISGNRGPVAPRQKRALDTGSGHPQLQPEGLVAL